MFNVIYLIVRIRGFCLLLMIIYLHTKNSKIKRIEVTFNSNLHYTSYENFEQISINLVKETSLFGDNQTYASDRLILFILLINIKFISA